MINWPLFILLLTFYASHSLLADLKIKAWLKPVVPSTHYRIVYNLVSLGFVATIAWVYINSPKVDLADFPIWVTVAGWTGFISGFLLNYLAISQYDGAEFIGTSYLDQPVEAQAGLGGTLNISGINQWVRHPIYSSILMIAWSWFLISPNSAVLHIASVTTAYIPVGIYLEERKLVIEFGDAYRKYQQEVKRLIPGVW
ncbi:MAG: isoprenylcysteine carboxylmethyltransferase family protein [Bacteroidota bacterium]